MVIDAIFNNQRNVFQWDYRVTGIFPNIAVPRIAPAGGLGSIVDWYIGILEIPHQVFGQSSYLLRN
ncbi:hypothetical protein J2741_000236 [Methanolinea mesophila]|uniref:hypothetical protein n=1 Tax=Methanolinea mesophila TaxID=547055 RepID=UPI001AE86E43|nr:hypothetical protein [Methanolinea mesophila]MBP1927689.1 hypothetical protein [Methanolinea mesophila]